MNVSRQTAADIAGLTVRQLRHWVKIGAVVPYSTGRVVSQRDGVGRIVSTVVEGTAEGSSQWETGTLWSPGDVFRLTLIRQALDLVGSKLWEPIIREAWALDTDTLDDLAVIAVFSASQPVVCVRAITSETDHMLRIDSEWMLVLPLQPCWTAMAVCERHAGE